MFYLLTGVGKIKLQMIFSIITGILNIPLSVIFAKYLKLGTAGVILSTMVCILYGPLLAKIQYNKIIYGKASGIWNE